jgi:hypothetical protein
MAASAVEIDKVDVVSAASKKSSIFFPEYDEPTMMKLETKATAVNIITYKLRPLIDYSCDTAR